jgi:hypothetical protein
MKNRYRIEIFDENKNNDITIYSDKNIDREYLYEIVFSNIANFAGNIRGYVFDNLKKRKLVAVYLPMEIVNKYNKRELTTLGIN